jgi:hypothetical protein
MKFPEELVTYDRDKFPFAGIFEDMTNLATDKCFSPVEAYVWYESQRREVGLNPSPDYCSTAITNSGHGRNPDLSDRERISKNTQTAQQLMVELVGKGVLHERSAIMPADLGYVSHWKQSDYMQLWLSVIGGIDLGLRNTNQNANHFEKQLAQAFEMCEVDLGRMNDKSILAIERAPEYFRFAKAFGEVFRYTFNESRPVHRIISLVDPKESLGCRTERAFAHTLGVPSYNLVCSGPAVTAHEIISNPTLRNDLDDIVRFGGTTIQLLNGNILGLVQQEPEK